MTRVLLLSTADTDLLAARSSGAGYRVANPARTEPAAVPVLVEDVDVVVVRPVSYTHLTLPTTPYV